jgi:single-strand DNA-binding protein
MSLNRVQLIGFVGKDPEVRYLDSGIAVATITLATTERGYTLQNGTQVPDRTEWHNIVAWKGLAEIAEKYVRKGSQLYIEGKITTRKWEKDGITRYNTEIVANSIELLGRKPDAMQTATQEFATRTEENTPAPAKSSDAVNSSDLPPEEFKDDLPF